MAKSRFQAFLPWIYVALLGYCIADIAILSVRDKMLPDQTPPPRPQKQGIVGFTPKGSYSVIISRNIFNSDGTIPDPLVPKGQEGKTKGPDSVPVPSNLPLALLGTIVHSNPDKSIANIELKGKSQVLAFHPKMDIGGLATLMAVERSKIIIRNLNNQSLEFLEMKTGNKLTFGNNKPTPAATGLTMPSSGEVQQTAPNKFEIKKSDLLKYTSNMAEVLQQAAMAPKRSSTGEIECFKFLSIQPGSIYTQLGFQNGDCIKSVNGEAVDSPAKAMEMYNQLKSSNNVQLKIERDGRDQNFDYNVK